MRYIYPSMTCPRRGLKCFELLTKDSLIHFCCGNEDQHYEQNLTHFVVAMNTNTTNLAHTIERIGWQSQPSGRGTLDVIWSCLFTVFLCVWTILSLNVPAKNTSSIPFTLCKVKWMLVAVLGPEWILGFAGGQWAMARRSARKIRALGKETKVWSHWTMTHSYFADMGGIRLKLKDDEFPINAEMLRGLLERDDIAFPEIAEITKAAILDRSKADVIAKVLTALQTAWFVVQCIARGITGLGLTSLELSTCAFVVCALATNYLWWSKPRDVFEPIVICKDMSVADLVGPNYSPSWRLSPLEQFDALTGSLTVNVLPLMQRCNPWHFEMSSKQKHEEDKKRFRNDRFPPGERDWSLTVFLSITSTAFGAVYLAGWNIDFPTPVESVFWRVAICCQLGLVAVFWTLDLSMEVYKWRKRNQRHTGKKRHTRPGKNFDLVAPVGIVVCIIITAIYVCCRLYLIIEAFMSLRALPLKAYQSINWIGSIPHLH